MKLGFVGLGQMGKPMALNMLKSGLPMLVVSATDGELPRVHRNAGTRDDGFAEARRRTSSFSGACPMATSCARCCSAAKASRGS